MRQVKMTLAGPGRKTLAEIPRMTFIVLAAGAAILTLPPEGGRAQAICSAPHSSPTLAQSGSVRTLPSGAGWLQLSVYNQQSDEFFNHLGTSQPFLADSEFHTRSLFLTGAVGLREGLEIWAQVPIHRLRVDAASGESTSTGVGDIRLATRMGSELLGLEVPLALRAGLKVPGSGFPVDATVLPLSEGQTDLEVSLESGTGLGELPLYLMGWVGYRWRGENADADRKPGNERFAHLAVGGTVGGLAWELAADGLWGQAPEAQGITLEGERRRLIQVMPTIGYGIGGGRLELGSQIPVYGKNLPNGVGLSLGYRYAWGMEPPSLLEQLDQLLGTR
jgi:hypothetical protein